MSNTKQADSGPAEGARRATEAGPESGRGGKGPLVGQAQDERGPGAAPCASLEPMSLKYGVTAATLSPVRRCFSFLWRRGPQDPAGGSGRRAGPPNEVGDRRSGNGERTAAGTHPAHGGPEAFSAVDLEEMSRAQSASTRALLRVGSDFAGLGPAAVGLLPAAPSRGFAAPAARRGPKTPYTDEQLVGEIRRTISE